MTIMFKRLWDQFLGVKSDREVIREVLRDPTVRKARQQIRQSERLLTSLEALEGKKKPDE